MASVQDKMAELVTTIKSYIDERQLGNTVPGETGPKGDAGLSAYEVWISLGNTGTEEAYLESLKGPQGEQGLQGEPRDLTGYATVESLTETDAIARGRLTALVFDSESQLSDWIVGIYERTDGEIPANLVVGQNLYVKIQSEPDYWVSSVPVESIDNLTSLPTDKVSLDSYVDKDSPQTLDGLKSFSVLPQSALEPVDDKDLVNKKYADNKNTYYEKTILYSDWNNNEAVIEDIALEDGDKLIIYPRGGQTHEETIEMREAYAEAEISYVGDEITNTITLTATIAPEITINVLVEVRK